MANDCDKINCSAPGKVVIHGEHAVVYGKTAFAMSIDLRTNVEIKIEGNDVHLKLKSLNADHIWPFASFETIRLINEPNTVIQFDESLLIKIKNFVDDMHFDAFYPFGEDRECDAANYHIPKKSYQITDKEINDSLRAFLLLYIGISDSYCSSRRLPMDITVSSSLPCGAGLGSSSAYSVAMTAALFGAYKIEASRELISDWAFQIDKLFHGKPSGIDNSICTFGGALLFREGKIQKKLARVPKINVILVNTQIGRNTKALVAKSRALYDQFPAVIDHIWCAIDEISKHAWECIENHDTVDISQLKDLFHVNQNLLNSIGAGHSAIDTIVEHAMRYDLSAKLTGAGGGGSVIILVDSNKTSKHTVQQIMNELEDGHGFMCWNVDLGCTGVTSNK